MALEHLIAVLERRADGEIAALLEDARGRAGAIAEAAAERQRRRRAELATAREADRRVAVELGLASARREARQLVLEARARFLDRVLAAARARFGALQGSPSYLAALPREVAATLAALGDRPSTFVADPAVAHALTELTRGRPGVTVRAEPATAAGFVVTADDGSVEVDGTFEGRLVSLAPGLRVEILRHVGVGA